MCSSFAFLFLTLQMLRHRPGQVHHGDVQIKPLRPLGLSRTDLLALLLLTERLRAVIDTKPHVDKVHILHIDSAG